MRRSLLAVVVLLAASQIASAQDAPQVQTGIEKLADQILASAKQLPGFDDRQAQRDVVFVTYLERKQALKAATENGGDEIEAELALAQAAAELKAAYDGEAITLLANFLTAQAAVVSTEAAVRVENATGQDITAAGAHMFALELLDAFRGPLPMFAEELDGQIVEMIRRADASGAADVSEVLNELQLYMAAPERQRELRRQAALLDRLGNGAVAKPVPGQKAKDDDVVPEDNSVLDMFEPAVLEKTPKELQIEKLLATAQAKIEVDEDYKSALPDLNEILKINPDHIDGLLLRAKVQEGLSQYDSAAADCTRVLKIDPQNADAYARRAWIRRSQGIIGESIADFTRLIEIDPQDSGALVGRGSARGALGDLDGEIEDYTRAIAIHPGGEGIGMYYHDRANAYQRKGNMDAALADLNIAVKERPDDLFFLNERAQVHMRMANHDKAVVELNRILATQPNADSRALRGIALVELGSVEAGIADLESALELDPENKIALRALPIAKQKRGQ